MICLLKGTIDFTAVHGVLTQLGIKIAKYEVTEILSQHEKSKQAQLTKEEFEEVNSNILIQNRIFFILIALC
jgi:Ca2+-binding EF-hand superfamily protein